MFKTLPRSKPASLGEEKKKKNAVRLLAETSVCSNVANGTVKKKEKKKHKIRNCIDTVIGGREALSFDWETVTIRSCFSVLFFL